jgi:D-amino-acid dehydrogenase
VTIIDPLPPPGGASYGNAGMISADTSVPIALPGMLRKVPSWLTDPLGPLAVRPSYFPKALPWLMRWIAASRMPRVLEISDAMRALHKDAFLCWKELLGPQNFADLVRPAGQVHVWETDAETPGAALERRLRERQRIASQALTSDDLRQMFPGISTAVRRGVLVPGNGYTVSPQRIVQTLHRLFLEAGGRVVPENVMKIMPREDGGYDLMTNVGFHTVQQIVVAAGAWSLRLLEPLGVSVPLEAERGYHVMLPTPNVSLTTTLSNKSRSFGVTPMEQGLRVAGTVEIAGLDAPPDERRAKALLANVRTMFPDVNTNGHRFWMGFRPSTPDSLPIVGEVAGRPGLFLAVGHGHFGMTGGPPSGRLLSQLINHQPTAFNAAAYGPQRFA